MTSSQIRRRVTMLTKILIALPVLVIAGVVVVAMQPSVFRVARTATIAAPAPAVFAQVNDFHNWEAWSPWAKLDPAMKQTYEAPAGTGAMSTWAGNSEVGEGRMTLTESRPTHLIRIEPGGDEISGGSEGVVNTGGGRVSRGPSAGPRAAAAREIGARRRW